MKIFLSGSKAVRSLPEKLTALLDEYCQQNCAFLVGDCAGADILMQKYLYEKGCENVTVYVSGGSVRFHAGRFPIRHIAVPEGITGFAFFRQKDIAMVHDCDAAVMLWDGKSRGTRCNIADMERLGKPYTVIRIRSSHMKYDVLQFIDSDTLREMLRGQTLAPAVECILIAQSKKPPVKMKLAALTERAESNPDAAFRTGVYNLRDYADFADALRKYIAAMQTALQLTESPVPQYVYLVQETDLSQETVFTSFASAANALRRELFEDETRSILRRKLDDPAAQPVIYTINEAGDIVSVSLYEDGDWNIEYAFAELPHTYQTGDIIEYNDEFYVVANICYADENTRWLKHADSTDLSLYCFGYSPDKAHSCGGTFGHFHVPLLAAERAKPDDLPFDMRPLKGFSLLMKGEMKNTDFLEWKRCFCGTSITFTKCFRKPFRIR